MKTIFPAILARCFVILLLLGISTKVGAQLQLDSTDNFDYQNLQYNTYLNSLDSAGRYANDGEQAHYQRWQNYWKQRIDTDGKFTTYLDRIANYNNDAFKVQMNTCNGGDWKQVGPFDMPCKDNSAQTNYPTGVGRFNKVVFDPDFASNGIVYALAHGGSLYKSTDQGEHWRDMTIGKIDRVGAYDLAVNPKRNNTIYLATGNGDQPNGFWDGINSSGLYVSYNGGETWSSTCLAYPRDAGCPAFGGSNNNVPIVNLKAPFEATDQRQITKVIIDPLDTNEIFVSTIHVRDTRNGGGGSILRSLDHGENWEEMQSGFFRDMERHPTNNNIIYAGGGRFRTGIYYTTDNGSTWNESQGIPFPSHATNPYGDGCNTTLAPDAHIYPQKICLDVNPLFPNNVYALIRYDTVALVGATYTCVAKVSIYKSIDNGQNFVFVAKVSTPGNDLRYGFAVDYEHNQGGSNGELYYVGNQWLHKGNSPIVNTLASNNNGFGGPNWTHGDINDIKFFEMPNGNLECYLATDGGIFKRTSYSSTGMDNWESINNGLAAVEYYSIATSPFDEQIVLGGAQDAGLFLYNHGPWFGLHKYGDGTGTYSSPITPNLLGGGVDTPFNGRQFDIDTNTDIPEKCDNPQNSMGLLDRNFPAGIVNTSASMKADYVPQFANDPIDPSILWAVVEEKIISNGQWEGQGDYHLLWRDELAGWSNTQLIPGPAGSGDGRDFSMLKIGKTGTNSKVYYIGRESADDNNPTYPPPSSWVGGYHAKNQMFRSTDEGQTWEDITPATTEGMGLNDFVIDENEPNKIWVVSPGRYHVAYSSDFGTNWTDIADSNIPNVPIFSVAIDPRNGTLDDAIYLGTDVGCFYKDNTLAGWECYNKHFPYSIIQDLDIAPDCGMIRAATFGRSLWESPLHPLPSQNYNENAVYLPPGNNTYQWSTPTYMGGDITIGSGNTLEVTSTIFMPAGSQIHVERGATLIVDGGKITSRGLCTPSMMWRGIFVEGNKLQAQTSANQGRVILKNGAIIEDARNAVSTSKLDQDGNILWNYTGGIIQATNTTFRNNIRSAEFLTYHNTFVSSTETPNVSFFKDCTFETTAPLKDYGSNPENFVSLLSVYGVSFQRNKFINRIPEEFDEESKGGGIYSIDAHYSVIGTCTSSTQNGCIGWNSNKFENLTNGIFSTSFQPSPRFTLIKGNSFKNCRQAIILEATDFDKVSSNTITVDNSAPSDFSFFTGVYILRGKSFVIQDNTIDLDPGTNIKTYGILTNKTGLSNSGNIFRNTISNTTYAYQSEFHNNRLLINCNEMLGAGTDFRMIPYAAPQVTLFPNQGTAPSAASLTGYDPNDKFDQCSPPSTEHINNYGTANSFLYYCSALTLLQPDPDCSSAFVNIFSSSVPPGGVDNCEGPTIPSNRLASDSKEFQLLAVQMEEEIDGGNTALLLDAIAQSPPPPASELYATVTQHSPFLSDEVLLSVIQTPNPLPDSLVRKLLVENSRLSSIVLSALESRSPAFDSTEMIMVISAQGTVSEREKLQRSIDHYHTISELYLSDYVRYLMVEDTLSGPRMDSVVWALEENGTDASFSLLASIYNRESKFQDARDVLEQLDLGNSESLDFSNYGNFLIDLAESGRGFDSINNSESALLVNISAGESQASQFSKNILDWNNGWLTRTRVPFDFVANSSKIDKVKSPLLPEKQEREFALYPNPNSGVFTLEWNLGAQNTDGLVQIFTLSGTKIAEISLSSKVSGRKEIDLRNFTQGLYIYQLSNAGQYLRSGKLLIQR